MSSPVVWSSGLLLTILAGVGTMERSAHNGFINIDITIPDFEVESAVRIGANPGFIVNSCPLATEIRQGYQVSSFALLAFGEIKLFHVIHLPTEVEFFTVYTNQ